MDEHEEYPAVADVARNSKFWYMSIDSVTVPNLLKPLALQDLRRQMRMMPRLHTLDIGGAYEPEILTWLNGSRQNLFYGFYFDNFYSS